EEIFSNVIDAQDSPRVRDSAVQDGSHKDIWNEYSDPHTLQDSTPDDGIHQQVGTTDSGINEVKDITVDDVNYKLDERVDSDTHVVKDIAVDDGYNKPSSIAVTFDMMETPERQEVTLDAHEELAVMQKKYDEDNNTPLKELEPEEGQQMHDLAGSMSVENNKDSYQDSLHVSYPPTRHNSLPTALLNATAAKEKMTNAEERLVSSSHVNEAADSMDMTNDLKSCNGNNSKSLESIGEIDSNAQPSSIMPITESSHQTTTQAPQLSTDQVLQPHPPPPPPPPRRSPSSSLDGEVSTLPQPPPQPPPPPPPTLTLF
ncbi:formin-like protein 20, partial [Trifolium medium]|nr:formin-like protein 20 [Trifolium medium]